MLENSPISQPERHLININAVAFICQKEQSR